MHSPLLRPTTRELELLQWCGQLHKIRFNEYTALRFATNAIQALRDARHTDRNPLGQYNMAYEGVYALCLGSIYRHGLLPTGQVRQRPLVIHLGCDMLQLPFQDRDKILNASKYQELITCDAPEQVEDVVAHDMVALGSRALAQARRAYPDWFL